MGLSEAWEDLGPHIRRTSSIKGQQVYSSLPKRIVDTLIDAAEGHFQNMNYNIQDIEVFCKNFLRNNKYTFLGTDWVIRDVISYFQENRHEITGAREKYEQLLLDTQIDLTTLPGGVCNKVAYLVLYLGLQEHYELYRDSISVGENPE